LYRPICFTFREEAQFFSVTAHAVMGYGLGAAGAAGGEESRQRERERAGRRGGSLRRG
jgi:hypothetical protein